MIARLAHDETNIKLALLLLFDMVYSISEGMRDKLRHSTEPVFFPEVILTGKARRRTVIVLLLGLET